MQVANSLVGGFVACGSGHCVQIMAPTASTADVARCSIAQLQTSLHYWDERLEAAGHAHLACSELMNKGKGREYAWMP